ncbi:DUF3494 domain-containing protein [Psychroserpens burtonensis]|uniref:DUF3494 domain-containing protein n=1 Tax=Psychroserpens burtonensis TaxID=49278 RepID=A0A5C7B8F6_9FLAO|nr:ice-binding family protein [Psychroserpens burtonensis]TXE18566.1 DUF3494 domain-containing protein [Psychroserpens burtonensis]
MNKKLLFSLTTIGLLFFSSLSFSQTLELGTLQPFGTFAGSGAVTNGGTSAGDAGTNAGIISGIGFDSANGYTGSTYTNDPTTVQARIDLLRVYIHLDDVFVTEPSTHLPAFGSGETISPGVYSIGGAGSIAGALTLDGGGDPNAFFILKFEGALTVGAGSTITLSNGTRAANVFWISQGAISVAASSAMEGTLFAHPGAVTLGVNSTINGRLLTSEGAITIAAGGEVIMPIGNSTIPIKCLGDCSSAAAVDILGSLKGFALFTSFGAVANAATSGIVGAIGTNGGAISGFLTSTHTNSDLTTGIFYNSDAVTAQAVIDLDNAYESLMALPNTETGHTPAFGSGETINAGVYFIAGAGSLAGTITLDGQDDPNAIFVFKFAGAFSVAAQSRVILTNGAKRCNVFWLGGAGVPTGAVSIGTFTYMKGTVISHGGACTAGANTSVEGRMLSTGGAIGFSTGVIYTDTLCFDDPVDSNPSIALVKTSSVSGTGTLGDVITYTFTVENTGDTTLTNIEVTDPMSGLTITGSPVTSLEIGASSSAISGAYTITQADIDTGSVTNSALATAQDPEGNNITDTSGTTINNDTPTVTPLTKTPVIALVKIASVSGTGTLGDLITYTFTVENTGNTTLTNVTVTDPMIGLTITGNPITFLEVGGSSDVITGTYTITQEDINTGSVTNSALATAQDPEGNDITDISGTTNENDTPTVTKLPAIALVKSAIVSGTGTLGDIITYTFTVENTGETTLTNVVVTDPMEGLTITGSPIDSLEPGDSSDTITGTYTITQEDINTGSVTNSALATAQDPEGNNITDISGTTNDNDTPTVTTLTQNPAIALVKSAVVSGTGTLGDIITYTFTVENTGNTTLTNVTVTDPMEGLTITGNPISSLEVGASSDVIIGTYTITQEDINTGSVTNSALATAQDPEGNDITDISGTTNENDTPTVTKLPAIALVKSAIVSGTGTLGDIITYTFTVENTGETTLTDVVVTDPMEGLTITGSPIASLEPGDSSDTITGTYTITQADMDTGSVTNSALATAQDPEGNDITDISGTTKENDTPTVTTLIQNPAIALVKSAVVSGTGTLGDLITYTFTVENTGDTTLTNITVTDPMEGLTISGSSIASLEVGDSSDAITGTYTITQEDIDAGNVTNSALASAQDPEGNDITDTSGTTKENDTPTVTTLVRNPNIVLVKNAILSGTGVLGDIITYIFTIENTGDTTLTNVVITDPMVGLIINGNPITSLAPGTATIALGSYTITQDDIDAGSISNSALVTAQDPEGNDITDISGTTKENDTPTVITPVVLPDFTPTIAIDELGFLAAGSTKDFVVNISEVKGASSNGQIVLTITKGSAFLITYAANTTSSNVNDGVQVNNSDWIITENSFIITMILKPGVIIEANTFSSIGFTVKRELDIPTQTTQPITITITNGSGEDSQTFNNTYNIVIKAQ